MTPQALWATLAAEGLVTGNMPASDPAAAPWYVRVMLCAAGLIAAVFLLGFIGLAFTFVVDNRSAAGAAGLALIAGALLIFRGAPRSDFGAMFALAVSFAGQALFVYGFLALFERQPGPVAWAVLAGFELALAIWMPNFIHRVVSAYAASLAFMYALLGIGLGFLAAALALLVAWLWLNEARLARRHSRLAPIAYGFTIGLLHIEAMPFFGREWMALPGARMVSPWGAPWMGEVLAAAALVYTVAALVRRAAWRWDDRRAMLAVGAAAAIGAVSLKAPGVAAGLTIALLGFANGNRVLLGLGIAGLLVYLSAYYYLLQITLLAKSGVLAATGVVLLGARWLALQRIVPEDRHG